jgi:hypothetical protein
MTNLHIYSQNFSNDDFPFNKKPLKKHVERTNLKAWNEESHSIVFLYLRQGGHLSLGPSTARIGIDSNEMNV